MSVLGSMMLTTEAANLVSEMLRGQDFYQPSHETIFDTIIELMAARNPPTRSPSPATQARWRPVEGGRRR